MKINALIAAAAMVAALAVPAVAAPIVTGPYNLVGVNAKMLFDTVVNDYDIRAVDILGIKVIGKSVDGTIIVKVTTVTGPQIIGMRSSESVIRENPCYEKFGGFHRAVKVGGSFTCVYDPSMYVSEPIYSAPKSVTTDVKKPVCNDTEKTRSGSIRGGFFITETTTQTAGAC